MSVATATAVSIGLAAGTATSGIVAAKMGSNAQRRASETAAASETAGSQAQLEYLKKKDAQDQANWERTYQQNLAQYQAREGRLGPYRQVGEQAVRTLGSLLRPPSGYPTAPPAPRPAAPAAAVVSATPPAAQPPVGPLMYDPNSGRMVPVAATNLRQLTAGV